MGGAEDAGGMRGRGARGGGGVLRIDAPGPPPVAGHRISAVVGGGTAVVGDPSGKDEARQHITTEQIEHNKVGIRAQLSQVLTLDGERGLLVDNQDWLCSLHYIQFLRDIGRHFSVNTMLSKASVKLRLEKGLSFIEFNYQLLQAYDFKHL